MNNYLGSLGGAGAGRIAGVVEGPLLAVRTLAPTVEVANSVLRPG